MVIQTGGHVKLINLRVICYIVGINRTLRISYAHLKCQRFPDNKVPVPLPRPPALAGFLPTLAAPDRGALLQVCIPPAITDSHVLAPTVALPGHDRQPQETGELEIHFPL